MSVVSDSRVSDSRVSDSRVSDSRGCSGDLVLLVLLLRVFLHYRVGVIFDRVRLHVHVFVFVFA
jgi:hypothetical protein